MLPKYQDAAIYNRRCRHAVKEVDGIGKTTAKKFPQHHNSLTAAFFDGWFRNNISIMFRSLSLRERMEIRTMNSGITKRSVLITGRKTSISLEDMFWHALKDIAAEQRTSAAALLVQINQKRGTTNFSSAVRQFVMAYYINLVNDLRKSATSPLGDSETQSAGVTRAPLPTTLI